MQELLEKTKINLEKSYENKEIPDNFGGLRKSVQNKWFRPNKVKAIFSLFVGLAFHAFTLYIAYWIINLEFYFLAPVGWFLVGTSVCSLFVLGHDCAHSAFFKSNRWNDFWGQILFLAPFYPYFAWKYSHNAHHKFTNKLEFNAKDIYYDNAWIPLTPKQFKILKRFSPKRALMYKMGRYFPPFGSFMHNILTHGSSDKFNESQKGKVKFSYLVLGICMVSISSGIYYLTGSVFSIFHYYILPGLFFQFWMSLYTYQHHTSEEMEFYKPEDWNQYKGQILSTYNSLSPKWLSFLHFHIDVHTPHHLSTAIPCYHLRQAYSEMKTSDYSHDIKEGKIDFGYYLKQVRSCHLWDDKNRKYRKFSDVEA